MDFTIGQFVGWTHGEHHRIAVVVAVNDKCVKLDGATKSYWISKAALEKKINKPYPRAGMAL